LLLFEIHNFCYGRPLWLLAPEAKKHSYATSLICFRFGSPFMLIWLLPQTFQYVRVQCGCQGEKWGHQGCCCYYLSSQVFQRLSDTLPGRGLPLRSMQRLNNDTSNNTVST
jgi:hypothetical protein